MLSSTSAKLPPQKYCRIIQEMLAVLPDPVDKLTLLNRVLAHYRRIPRLYRLYPHWAEIALRKMVLAEAQKIRPESRARARQLMRQGVISTPRPLLWKVYRLRHIIISALVLLLVGGLSMAAAALYDFIQPAKMTPRPSGTVSQTIAEPLPLASSTHPPVLDPIGLPESEISPSAERNPRLDFGYHALIEIVTSDALENSAGSGSALAVKKAPVLEPVAQTVREVDRPIEIPPLPEYIEKPIWLVESTQEAEMYSNRLHVITTHTVDNIPRRYLLFPRNAPLRENAIQAAHQIAGIVFHASESDLFPFSPEMNTSIKNNTAALIQYLKRNKGYHYFIDRFGRVYRIVREDHAAFHAGHAIWSDAERYYLNLNHAFIGICFEGRDFEILDKSESAPSSSVPRIVALPHSSINEAQLVSGKELTEWLRVKYRIREHNCVPHGLVSINPREKLIGRHLDLSHGFPFERFGLNDKYQSPLPSIVDFGFTYDRFFENIFQGNPWPGAQRSITLLTQMAGDKKLNIATYQKRLQNKFDAYYAMERAIRASDLENTQPSVNMGHAETASKK